MEESEKRRERLKAMRMEASQGDVNNDVGNFTESHGLSNPLIETCASHQESGAPQRFDYYTDPMSLFSGNKRSKVGQNISQEHFTPPRLLKTVVTPPSALQGQVNYSAEQGLHQPQETPIQSPIGMVHPFGMQSETPRAAWSGSSHHFPSNSPRGVSFPNPGFGQGDNPLINSGQGRGYWPNNSLNPGSGFGGIASFGQDGGPHSYSDQGRGYLSNNNSPRPSSGYAGNPSFPHGVRPSYGSGQGRGYWSNNSPRPGSGYGGSPSFAQGGRHCFSSGQSRGNWFGNSPLSDSRFGGMPGLNSGRGRGGRGGRGRGSRDTNVSAEVRPDLYYNKSMVEDPWKFLKPVVWKIENFSGESPNPLKSWIPKSISSVKNSKPKETSSESKSGPSLAEYLAASFNEAVENSGINDESVLHN